jgi:hypothetical protein|eukprot:sb/3478548/
MFGQILWVILGTQAYVARERESGDGERKRERERERNIGREIEKKIEIDRDGEKQRDIERDNGTHNVAELLSTNPFRETNIQTRMGVYCTPIQFLYFSVCF